MMIMTNTFHSKEDEVMMALDNKSIKVFNHTEKLLTQTCELFEFFLRLQEEQKILLEDYEKCSAIISTASRFYQNQEEAIENQIG